MSGPEVHNGCCSDPDLVTPLIVDVDATTGLFPEIQGYIDGVPVVIYVYDLSDGRVYVGCDFEDDDLSGPVGEMIALTNIARIAYVAQYFVDQLDK
jgi:hypothetical protein